MNIFVRIYFIRIIYHQNKSKNKNVRNRDYGINIVTTSDATVVIFSVKKNKIFDL